MFSVAVNCYPRPGNPSSWKVYSAEVRPPLPEFLGPSDVARLKLTLRDAVLGILRATISQDVIVQRACESWDVEAWGTLARQVEE